jgi:hypothetical protein
MAKRTATRRPGGRLAMTGRCATALVGGYAAAAGLATLCARLLPIARVEATAWGMTMSFLLYALIALWAFHERRLAVVAAATWGIAAGSIAVLFLIGVRP